MIPKNDTSIVTTAPVFLGGGSVPLPVGTPIAVTADHARDLIGENAAVLEADWPAWQDRQKQPPQPPATSPQSSDK